jgi:hypothetical protein
MGGFIQNYIQSQQTVRNKLFATNCSQHTTGTMENTPVR